MISQKKLDELLKEHDDSITSLEFDETPEPKFVSIRNASCRVCKEEYNKSMFNNIAFCSTECKTVFYTKKTDQASDFDFNNQYPDKKTMFAKISYRNKWGDRKYYFVCNKCALICYSIYKEGHKQKCWSDRA